MRKLQIHGLQYQIRPSYVLSYMRALVKDVHKPLFLLRFSIPFWALAHVFGRDAKYWYRCYLSFSAYSLVGTTIKGDLPEHLLSDEYHVRVNGKRAYVATTCAQGCILGTETVTGTDAQTLSQGYATFKEEAVDVHRDYSPLSVNIDGWYATWNAWRALFPKIFIIECFLHAFIKVRDRATKKMKETFEIAAEKIWQIYRAESKRSMGQRLRRLCEWTASHIHDCPMKDNIIKLCAKKKRWLAHLDFPQAYRTSNMLDRLMKFMNRHADSAQMFRGSITRTTQHFRAFALLYNFTPSSPVVTRKSPNLQSPAARVNGFIYHHNWLQNLLISASCGGYRHHCNPP